MPPLFLVIFAWCRSVAEGVLTFRRYSRGRGSPGSADPARRFAEPCTDIRWTLVGRRMGIFDVHVIEVHKLYRLRPSRSAVVIGDCRTVEETLEHVERGLLRREVRARLRLFRRRPRCASFLPPGRCFETEKSNSAPPRIGGERRHRASALSRRARRCRPVAESLMPSCHRRPSLFHWDCARRRSRTGSALSPGKTPSGSTHSPRSRSGRPDLAAKQRSERGRNRRQDVGR